MYFPRTRLRRLRNSEVVRNLVSETTLRASCLVEPMFIIPGKQKSHEIKSMPNVYHMTVDRAVEKAHSAFALGVRAVLLFGVVSEKDECGSYAANDDGIVQQAISAIIKELTDICVFTDVCLCEYTSHGHCGVVIDGRIDNDSTLPLLADVAVSHARAGADFVAPSDMMDGRVKAIRDALDCNGFDGVGIMSYSSKFASSFYGPFREAAGSAPQFGDRSTYQMDHRNRREAMREIEFDIKEGADIVMIKPALSYLDIIRDARERYELPLAAYNVSGEYSMVMNAAKAGLADGERMMMEILTSIKRAGADVIITYFASRAAQLLEHTK